MGIGIDKVKKALYSICDVLQEEKEELTEIDSRLGDGDMGISICLLYTSDAADD